MIEMNKEVPQEKPEEKKEPEFDCSIKILFNSKNKNIATEVNVPDLVIGYGLCEMLKIAVNNHIARLMQAQAPKVVPAKGGILNFVRGKR